MCENRLTSGEKLCICLLVPFYPIILPFSIPFYYYAEYRAERSFREEEETIIEVVMMISRKGRIMKLKMINKYNLF